MKLVLLFVFYLLLLLIGTGIAHAMSSVNYRMQWDSITQGTERSSSTNHILSDSIGGFGAGDSSSPNSSLYAGYRVPESSSSSDPVEPPPSNPPGSGSNNTPLPPPLSITSPRIDRISTTTAILRWTTNRPATAYFEYSSSTSDIILGFNDRYSYLTSHEFLLAGLSPSSTYRIRFQSVDQLFNTRWSDPLLFTTLPHYPTPIITTARVSFLSHDRAFIHWTTDINTTGRITLSIDGTTSTPKTFSEATSSQTHLQELTNLLPNTLYNYTLTALADGRRTAQTTGTFRTLEDTIPPDNVSNFRGTYKRTDHLIELRWINPRDRDFAEVIISRLHRETGEDQITICTTTSTICLDSFIETAGSSTYRAVARDRHGNRSSGALTFVLIPGFATTTSRLTPPPTNTARTLNENPIEETDESDPTAPEDEFSPSRPTIHPPSALPPILSPSPFSPSSTINSTAPSSTESHSTSTNAFALSFSPSFSLSHTSGSIPLLPNAKNTYSTYETVAVHISLPIGNTPREAFSQGQIILRDGSIYQLEYRSPQQAYVSSFTFSKASDKEPVRIQIKSTDGRVWDQQFQFQVLPQGIVLDASDATKSSPLEGVEVFVLKESDSTSEARIRSDKNGLYLIMTDPGGYTLRAEKSGYQPYSESIRTENGIIAHTIQLKKISAPVETANLEKRSFIQKVGAFGEQLLVKTQALYSQVASASTQRAIQVAVTPTVAAASLSSFATASHAGTLFSYLRLLITQPILLLRRRKRKQWGVVYNALTKIPLDIATVKLLRADTGSVVQVHITDSEGRFFFAAPAGRYRIHVQRQGYTFPTQYLKDTTTDIDLTDIYHGEPIEITNEHTLISNIPLDPLEPESVPAAIIRKKRIRTIQTYVSWVSSALAGISLILAPGILTGALFGFQIIFLLLFYRLSIPNRPPHWGKIYDDNGKHPLKQTVIRLFDKKFNKLVETQITGSDGGYGFLARKSVYYLIAEKPGYVRYLSPEINVTSAERAAVQIPIVMKKNSV